MKQSAANKGGATFQVRSGNAPREQPFFATPAKSWWDRRGEGRRQSVPRSAEVAYPAKRP